MTASSRGSNESRSRDISIMVSSTVYNFEDDLDQICAILERYGYTVLNSHWGTIRARPGQSNLQLCLEAVQNCDFFLGIIRPFYGSGRVGPLSIVHQEIRRAIELNKPRYFFAHDHVPYTRQLLAQYLYTRTGRWKGFPLNFKRTSVMDDLRVISIYDDAIRNEIPILERADHWVQTFRTIGELFRCIDCQFKDIETVRRAIT